MGLLALFAGFTCYALCTIWASGHSFTAVIGCVDGLKKQFTCDKYPSVQGLSNIVWAYAKLGALPNARPGSDESSGLEGRAKGNVGGLLDALAVEAVGQLMDARCSHKFIPQNLSNMVYGYALAHMPHVT